MRSPPWAETSSKPVAGLAVVKTILPSGPQAPPTPRPRFCRRTVTTVGWPPLAATFQSTVTVGHGGSRVNGKSPWDLMLVSAECGSELTLEAHGPDAQRALEALGDLLVNWVEPLEDDPPSPPKG